MDKQADSGVLFPAMSKKHEKAPDFSGEITIDLSNDVKVVRDGNLLTIKINGWKKRSKAGNTFMSLAVDRWVPKTQKPKDDFDEEVPF